MFKTVTVMLVTLFACLLAVNDARAQDQNRIGVTILFPAAVGLNWELSPQIAFRTEVSFSRSTTSASLANSISVSPVSVSKSITAGLSGVIYIHNLSPLRLYVSPRFAHTLGRVTGSTQVQSAVSGSFGAQYDFGLRFGIFAETGVGYTHSRTGPIVSNTILTSNSLASRSEIGAIVFF